jgi:methyl-accepting chemotaxis protein
VAIPIVKAANRNPLAQRKGTDTSTLAGDSANRIRNKLHPANYDQNTEGHTSMLKLMNIRIGTKLMVISAVSILLVFGMIAGQLLGNSSSGGSYETALRRALIARNVVDAKASERGMQTAVRDIRLAVTKEQFDKATQYLAARHQSVTRFIAESLPLTEAKENIERLNAAKNLADQYFSEVKAIADIKAKVVALRSNGALDAEGVKQVAQLDEQAERIARERTLPIAAKFEDTLNSAVDFAKGRSEVAAKEAAQEMALSSRISMAIGGVAVVILIGSAVFGTVSIGKPLRKMAGVLVDLTNDRIVDVPFTARGDEVGDIARTTEVFKQSIAEKVVNLRVRSGLDVVRSNVMIADGDYNIMYMNATLQEMMKEAETELRKVLPNFNASKLLGASMDVFHKNPAHQRRLLDSLNGTHESHITVGSQKFHLVATPVIDDHGKRAGTVVEWRNETIEKAVEGEVDNLVKAAVAGDFSQRVPLEGKKDFMLNLATSMNALCENTGKALQDLIGMLSALASGDLTKRIDAEYQGMFGELKHDANTMAERIGATIAEIKASAAEVTNASAEISTSTTDLSQRTEEQAASLEETSASMEEISATVKKNAENAQAANQSSSATRDVADRGGQVVAQAVEAMARIEESSRKISDIIGVIDEIARQTNLLALNAAVEAARAGEAGRGFAVVASEVRSLAQRSSQAAKDIKDLITNSNGQVKEGVDLVNRAGTALTEIVESIKKVAEIVADIANASAEQAGGIEQVNKALTQMDEVTQQNSALVEENAATAKTLEHQAKAMDERVAFFRVDGMGETGQRKQPMAAVVPSRGTTAAKQQPAAAPKRVAAGSNGGGPVRRMQSALATAVKSEPDWKEF